ncbi:MAG: histidinol-phosphate transaminase [Deltaproteobacteria bacterium]|nr:histidinol-phosphate transaminase [Deltaproteobacteria bacterium]
MRNLSGLFSPMLENMSPYSPIEPPDKIAKRLGLSIERIVKLDANENPFGTSAFVKEALAKQDYYAHYPDPAQSELREIISSYTGIKPSQIVGGTGSDELLDLLCRLFLETDDKAIGFSPSFAYYSHVVTLNRAVYQTCPRQDDFSISLSQARAVDLERVKLVFLCSPNNPSGNLIEEEVLDYFLGKNLIVVLDEAYFEFSGQSFDHKLDEHDNLVILRTFSKCFGLAGMRVGYGLMSEETAAALMRIKPPYSVNVAAETALKVCLENLDYYKAQVHQIIKTRERLLRELRQFGQIEAFPSQSNFVLCRISGCDAKVLRDNLEKEGVLIRYYQTMDLKNFIRISVGTEPQIDILLEKLKAYLPQKAKKTPR